MNRAERRLNEELLDFEKDPEALFSVRPITSDNLFEWQASLMGPQGTPYEGGIFNVNIHFPVEYPYKPPKFAFKTRIYHPYVSPNNGYICLHGLSIIYPDNWKPAFKIRQVLKSSSQF